jgi:Domain of unknown function (DUF4336)
VPDLLKKISAGIWTADGSVVTLYGFPFSTRMTVVRLEKGDLWVHSPIRVSDRLLEEIDALGRVKHLIAPNKLHYLFMPEWMQAFPDACSYSSPGLERKRPDLAFAQTLGPQPESAWAKEIKQTVFEGSAVMEEVIFFHCASRTLILTDLVENIRADSLNRRQRWFARIGGVLFPDGKTPLDWRLTFLLGKRKARTSLQTMLGWKPENVIISHGECVFGGGSEFLARSFAWVGRMMADPPVRCL